MKTQKDQIGTFVHFQPALDGTYNVWYAIVTIDNKHYLLTQNDCLKMTDWDGNAGFSLKVVNKSEITPQNAWCTIAADEVESLKYNPIEKEQLKNYFNPFDGSGEPLKFEDFPFNGYEKPEWFDEGFDEYDKLAIEVLGTDRIMTVRANCTMANELMGEDREWTTNEVLETKVFDLLKGIIAPTESTVQNGDAKLDVKITNGYKFCYLDSSYPCIIMTQFDYYQMLNKVKYTA